MQNAFKFYKTPRIGKMNRPH